MALGWRGSYIRYRGYFLNIVALYRQRGDLRAFTEVILSITTIIIFLVFALKPTALTIIALTNQIKEKKETLATLNQKLSDLQTAQAVYETNQLAINDLSLAVSTKPVPDMFTKQIIGLASKNSVAIQGISIGQIALTGKPLPIKKSVDIKPLPENASQMEISINARGDYNALSAFLTDLQNLKIETKIDMLDLNTTNKDGVNGINATITGRVPYLGQ